MFSIYHCMVVMKLISSLRILYVDKASSGIERKLYFYTAFAMGFRYYLIGRMIRVL